MVSPCLRAVGHVARVVDARGDLRLPELRERWRRAQRRHRGEGHRDRATVARLDLRLQVGARGARHVRAGPGIGPGRRVHAVLDRGLHQRVVRGMKRHQVDAVAEAVVGVELRRESIGEHAELEVVGRPGELAERGQIVVRPGRALAPHRFLQRGVLQVQVVVDEFARDVDRPRGCRRGTACRSRMLRGLSFRGLHERRNQGPMSSSRVAPAFCVEKARPDRVTGGIEAHQRIDESAACLDIHQRSREQGIEHQVADGIVAQQERLARRDLVARACRNERASLPGVDGSRDSASSTRCRSTARGRAGRDPGRSPLQ